VAASLASLLLLIAVLAFAVVRPWRLPEAVAAVPAAGIVVASGLVSWHRVGQELAALGPTVGFLAAVLVLAHEADREGVFGYAGALAARASRGSPRRLLGLVFVIASVTTAALSLDATVVLLTPVVLATAVRSGMRPRPHVYACSHLANSASLLLPVSNLTNLLAFAASGLTFAGFAALMALPWLAVVAVEYLVLRRFFGDDLTAAAPSPAPAPPVPAAPPRFALIVLGATLVGFGLAEPLGVHPAWFAAAGALVLAAHRRRRSRSRRRSAFDSSVRRRGAGAGQLLRAANLPFCAFVFALGIVVLAVRSSGFGGLVAGLVPGRPDLVGLLAAAALAAVLANLLNNLPATLMLVPLVGHSPGLVLAVLLGVNIGPNVTYVGSLATLLWRQVLHARDHPPAAWDFLRVGAITVPACLLVGVAALWLGLRVSGLS
jgi:arsenical pump membrane protein